VVEAFRAGARGYVLKDSPSAEIVAAIDAVGAGSRYFSARVADALVSASLPEPELTPREREVLDLIADGLGNKEIAARLDLSVRTVESHRINIKRKFDLDSAAALLKFALQRRRDHG
jgi:DNA-binding NarL/FixJ family response regulator